MPPADHVPTPPVLAAPLFDLAELPQAGNGMDLRAVKPRCQDERAGEIVVCASSSEKERVRPLPDDLVSPQGLPRAQMSLNEASSLGVELEAAAVGNGQISNRAMVRYKLKF